MRRSCGGGAERIAHSRTFLCSSVTFRRRDVADLADVDEEQGEEKEVPLHVELQMEKQLSSDMRAKMHLECENGQL